MQILKIASRYISWTSFAHQPLLLVNSTSIVRNNHPFNPQDTSWNFVFTTLGPPASLIRDSMYIAVTLYYTLAVITRILVELTFPFWCSHHAALIAGWRLVSESELATRYCIHTETDMLRANFDFIRFDMVFTSCKYTQCRKIVHNA